MKRILRSVTLTSALMLTILLGSGSLMAQTKTVSGIVKSGADILPGVTVLEKGTNNGTVTDGDGKFTITVSENASLVFSFVGMKPKEVPVGNQTSIDVDLEADITTLSEVVVIGYGTVEKRNLTSAVSALDNKQIKDIPINSAAQAITGRLAGVQVTTAEGSPDADVRIRVRGGMSITGDNSPLYVVDGVQVENALNVLAPQDIETISVLKDASVTAIYGSRGGNGVVIITTKSGKRGKTNVNFNAMAGVRQLGNKLDVWKPYEFVKYQYERSRGSTVGENNFLATYGTYEDMELYKEVPFVDWQEQVFGRNAVMQTYNLSIDGGTEVTSFNLSVSSQQEEGVMSGSDFDRKLVNFKFDHKVSDRVKVGFNVRYNNTLVNGAGTATEGSSSLNRLRHSVKYRPYLTPGQTVDSYDPDYADQTNANSLALINPVLLTEQEYQQRKRTTTNLNGSISFDITKYINFKSTVGVDFFTDDNYVFNDTITSLARQNGNQPMASIDADKRYILNNSNVLSFSSASLSSFPSNHKLDFMIGHEIYNTRTNTNFQDYRFFPVGITPELAFGSMQLGTPNPLSYTREVEDKLLSFFTRAFYSYADKYLLTLSLRADGSSKFAPENRWGYFPAASLMWRVSGEPFMEGLSSVVNDLKLRVSYGTVGNNRISDYLYLPVFTPSSYYSVNNNQVIGYAPSSLANSNLKWEATISRNMGIDASLFNGRLQASIDYYYNSSKDLLLDRVIPSTSGYPSQVQNIGETLNKGVELQLSGTPYHSNDWRYDVNFNISFNSNEIETLTPEQNSFLISSGWAGGNQPADFLVKVGQPVGTIWGLVTDGYYTLDDFDYESGSGTYTLKSTVASNQLITSIVPQPGVIKFRDINNDGVINDSDRKIIGKTTPKMFGGLNQTVTYKNFDLSVFINFQFGNDVLNANKLEFTSGYTINSNLLTTMDGRWTNVNDAGQTVTDPTELAALNENTKIWSPLTTASSFYVHSWAVEDGSFVRINNITLGYSLPASLLSKVKISRFRVYGTLNNVAVFSNYSGYDPEANTRRNTPLTPGVDYAAYPRSKGYLVGVNVTF